ncbi:MULTISPECIES: hypothetical protein [unclassified Streptomyces]|uniref:hypothetical protein n=1 Tax=unclassified Streptomyces TaxID=2593676 RepID=UPI0009620EA3|nr:hypothetical protein [Streptomyces sp. TSRI0281]OKI47593.1 hypothetical protein A6A29_00385 [Streptomyces sp. TSRI0281]
MRKLDAVSRLDAAAQALASGVITAPVPTGLPDWAEVHPDARPTEKHPTEKHPTENHPTQNHPADAHLAAHPASAPGWESCAA